jgi:GDP-D-mannose dehydratase
MSEKQKVALITGITGQDGSYLAEFLLEKATSCMALSAAPLRLKPSVLITCTKIRTSIILISSCITAI